MGSEYDFGVFSTWWCVVIYCPVSRLTFLSLVEFVRLSNTAPPPPVPCIDYLHTVVRPASSMYLASLKAEYLRSSNLSNSGNKIVEEEEEESAMI